MQDLLYNKNSIIGRLDLLGNQLNLTDFIKNHIINLRVINKMKYYKKINKLSDKDFKQIIGVKKETFNIMVEILESAYIQKHKKGGRNRKLTIEEQLLMTLKYLRQYVTQKELAFEFEVGEATVNDIIRWVEDTIIKDGRFSLPGKRVLVEDDSIEVVLVDVTECPIERPEKNRKNGIQEKRNDIQ